MLSVGGILYICKPCVCVQASCELSRALIRLLLFFRLPVNCIFLANVCGSVKDIFDPLFSRQMKRYGKLVHSPFAIFQLPANCIVVNLWIGGHFEVRCTKVVAANFTPPLAFPAAKFKIQREKSTAFITNQWRTTSHPKTRYAGIRWIKFQPYQVNVCSCYSSFGWFLNNAPITQFKSSICINHSLDVSDISFTLKNFFS